MVPEAAREARDESARCEDGARRVAELTRADVANPVVARTALMWVDTVRWSRRRVPRPVDEAAHLYPGREFTQPFVSH